MNRRPVFIELTGARGAGKSTLAGSLRAELERRNFPLNVGSKPSVVDRLGLALSSAPTMLKVEGQWQAWGVNTWQDRQRYRQRFRFYLKRRLRYSGDSGLFLLDEGIFQLMMMLCIRSGQEPEAIANWFSRHVPMPDIVISVEASEADIETRRKKRGNAGDLLKPHVVPRSWQGLKRIQAYIRRLPVDGATRSIIVDNSATSAPEEVAGRLVGEIVDACRRLGVHIEAEGDLSCSYSPTVHTSRDRPGCSPYSQN